MARIGSPRTATRCGSREPVEDGRPSTASPGLRPQMLVSVRTKITIAAACAIRPQGFLAASTPRTWRAAASQTATPPRLPRADDRNLKV